MAKWDDSSKFVAETLRTVVFALTGGVLAYLILDPIKAKTAYQAEIDKEKLLVKTRLVNDFLNRSYMYTSVAADAYNGKEPQKTLYNGDIYDQYRDQRNRMEIYFKGDIHAKLVTTDLLNDSLRNNMGKLAYDEWELIRKRFKEQNNDIAREALKQLEM